MVNYERRFERLLYRPTTSKSRDNNKNEAPRSEARKHMRTYVPAGISLTVARLDCSLAERRCTSPRHGLEG